MKLPAPTFAPAAAAVAQRFGAALLAASIISSAPLTPPALAAVPTSTELARIAEGLARIDYLLAHTTLAEQVAQLQNTAPAIERLGIPSYNWLNDDLHGVGRTTLKTTMFPNGCGRAAGGRTHASALAATAAA